MICIPQSIEESFSVFQDILDGNKTDDDITKFLESITLQEESFEVIAGAAKAMSSRAIEVPVSFETFDVCGTGGSGVAKSFNVSTTVGLVVASAGIKVAKHGNTAASSQSGSADVLTALGVPIQQTVEQIQKRLSDNNIAFLFAQSFHPALKRLMPIRRAIGHRTIFNLLGPLTNPTRPARQVVGVSDKKHLLPMAQALQALQKKSAIVLWGEEGLDEASIKGKTYYARLTALGEIIEGSFFPEQFGLRSLPVGETLQGGAPEENAKIILDILEQRNTGYEYSIVVLNAGIAFWISGKTNSIEEGMALAEKQILTREARNTLALLQ